jgi:hypothetical protein
MAKTSPGLWHTGERLGERARKRERERERERERALLRRERERESFIRSHGP